MIFVQENIEELKRQWTDKYVVVTGNRPELRRFEGYTGQVKTVNMSGRALVQFDAWSNIGWYDIETGYLQVVPKPDPALAGKKAETKKEAGPKAEAKAAPAKPAGKTSTADILAAARAGKAAAATPAAKPAAPATPAAAKPSGKMSTADILAAARAKKAPETEPTTASEEPVAEVAVESPAAPAKPQVTKTASAATALPKGQRPTVAQMLAYCREHDAK
jgi:hypothetical protein